MWWGFNRWRLSDLRAKEGLACRRLCLRPMDEYCFRCATASESAVFGEYSTPSSRLVGSSRHSVIVLTLWWLFVIGSSS
jgi:hypothetical protein